jgi:hypothetical protein
MYALARATKDAGAGWAYDLAYVLRGAGFHHAHRILFTGCDKVVLSFDIQGVAYSRISSAAPLGEPFVLTRVVYPGRVGYRRLDRLTGRAVFLVGGGECEAGKGRNGQEGSEPHGVS